MAINKKVLKILSIVKNVLVYTFFVFCLLLLVLSVFSKRDTDGAVKIFGHEIRIVVSPSMEKCEETDVSKFKIKDLPVKTLVYIDLVPEDEEKAKEWYSKLEIGDVLTFQYSISGRYETITHRIVNIEEKSGGYEITLEGDNKGSTSENVVVGQQIIQTWEKTDVNAPDYFNRVIGKVTGANYFFGLLVYAVSQPLGLALIVIVPCAIIIILQIIKIVNVLNASKHEKVEEKAQEQELTVEELRRRIAELEATQGAEEAEIAEPESGQTVEDVTTDQSQSEQ